LSRAERKSAVIKSGDKIALKRQKLLTDKKINDIISFVYKITALLKGKRL